MVRGSRMAAVIRKDLAVVVPEAREARVHTADRKALTVALMAVISLTDQALVAPDLAEVIHSPGRDTVLSLVSAFRMISTGHAIV
ncbi:hypothetical protein GCM10009414_32920 [Tatumella terrea]